MKRVLIGSLIFGVTASAAFAQSIEFRGALCLTAVTSTCTSLSSPWNVGDCATMRFSPPNIGTNGVVTDLNVLGSGFANSYHLASGSLVGSTFKTVNGTKITRTLSTWAPTMRITSLSPTPSSSTLSEALAGDISAFDNNPGCNVTFRAAATKKP